MKLPFDLTQAGPYFVWLCAALLVFCVIVQPVWCIVDCALSPLRSKTSKVIWIVLLFFTTYVLGFFYGAFAATSAQLRRATWFSLCFWVVTIAAFFVLAARQPNQIAPNQTAKIKANSKPQVKTKSSQSEQRKRQTSKKEKTNQRQQ